MKTRIITSLLIGAFAFFILRAFMINTEQRALSSKLIRLHVVANSDTEEDQTLKLKVRDAVLEKLWPELNRFRDRDDAEDYLVNNLDRIAGISEKTIKDEGYAYTAAVSVGNEDIPTTEYDTFRLPSGRYLSLRVVIGEGKGHNWWCVVFPPVCTAPSVQAIEASAPGLTDDEIALMTSESGGVIIKFRVLEIMEKLRACFGI